MSVTLYDERNPHPAGFMGYRVAVMVNLEHKQRYFSTNWDTKRVQHREAHKTNAMWLLQKEKAQGHRDNQAVQTIRSEYGTGVRGISIKYLYSRDRKGNNKAYKHLRFLVQGQQDGKGFCRRFPVTLKGWEDAVRYLANKKNLTRWRHLLKRYPI